MWTGSILATIHIYHFGSYCGIVQHPNTTAGLEKYCTTPAQATMHHASTTLNTTSSASERGSDFTLHFLRTGAV
jgi:hypothetical protein